jgi:hypothetical protein
VNDEARWTIWPSSLIFDNSADFLAATLAGKSLFDALLLSRLQIEGMLLHFLNDVFLLDLPLETPQGILDGLTVLNANFGHSIHPPSSIEFFDYPGRSSQSQTPVFR